MALISISAPLHRLLHRYEYFKFTPLAHSESHIYSSVSSAHATPLHVPRHNNPSYVIPSISNHNRESMISDHFQECLPAFPSQLRIKLSYWESQSNRWDFGQLSRGLFPRQCFCLHALVGVVYFFTFSNHLRGTVEPGLVSLGASSHSFLFHYVVCSPVLDRIWLLDYSRRRFMSRAVNLVLHVLF